MVPGGVLTASVPQLFQIPQQGAAPIVAQSMPSSAVSSLGASAVVAESPAKAVPGEPRVPAGVVQAASTVAKADRKEAEAKPQEAKSKTVGSLLSAYDDDADSDEGATEALNPKP
ncbi:unnamed protein product [Symbiodinium sp. CCMP2592]|nr:unnamed protein product [Symbiodinium sp. CCMP2592]